MVMIYFLVAPSELSSDASGNLISTTYTTLPSTGVTYYTYNPNQKTLTKLNLQQTIQNKQISDYFHKNDESLFVLKDGTIVSILGKTTRNFKTLPNVQKIRILNNQYIGLANGKLYSSKDLKTWSLDNSKPNNIVDIDVPAKQSYILHMSTPQQNLTIDTRKNKVLSQSKSETKKFGSDLNNFVRFADSGVYLHDKYFEKGYAYADIDHMNQVYMVPKIVSGYNVNDLHTSDQLAIVGLNVMNGPEKIDVGDQILFHY